MIQSTCILVTEITKSPVPR